MRHEEPNEPGIRPVRAMRTGAIADARDSCGGEGGGRRGKRAALGEPLARGEGRRWRPRAAGALSWTDRAGRVLASTGPEIRAASRPHRRVPQQRQAVQRPRRAAP